MVEDKIGEALTKVGVDVIKKVLTIALSDRIVDVDEMAIAGGPKREVGV